MKWLETVIPAKAGIQLKISRSELDSRLRGNDAKWDDGGQGGISLIEVLLIVSMIGFLVLVVSNLPGAMNLISRSNHQSIAREIATKQIEDKRALSFANLALTGPDGVSYIDSRLSLLPSGAGKVIIVDCDPTICTQSENAKQVTVEVTWKEFGNDTKVTLHTLIAEGGLR